MGSSPRRRITPTDVDAVRSLLANTSAQVLTPPPPSDGDVDKAGGAYAASIRRWSRAAEKPAGLVVVPSSTEQVAVAVRYAHEHNVDLAVKGGGHSTAGVSSTDGGLLIDLNARLRGVSVDTAGKVFRVQGGATWSDVDAAGVKHGLATVGGTVSDTGVGGLILGGGYGWLSGQHGLSIDCLVEATVVLATGDVVTASEREHADLFWALRGAGQNFGVVTEFVLRAFDQGPVWAGLLVFPSPTRDLVGRIVEATNDLYQPDAAGRTRVGGRGAGGITIARPPPAGGSVAIVVAIIYFGSEAEARALYAPLYDLAPALDTTALVPYPVVNTILAPPIGLRASMKGLSFALPLRPAFAQHIFDRYVQFTEDNEDAHGSVIMWEIYDPVRVVSLEGTGSFANRGWHLNGLALPLWHKAEHDQAYRQWARDISELFKQELDAHDSGTTSKGSVKLYGNYDQYDERARDIFGENYARLQSLKARYDATNLFDKLFPIAPRA